MRTVGIRAKPSAVTFAILDSDQNRILNVETIAIPIALDIPDALRYVRNTVLDVLREYGITHGCIRETEPSAKSPNIRRIQIEGVIQESFASSNLAAYFVGHIASISARIDIDRQDFKPLVNGEKEFDQIEGWNQFDHDEREALLAALGARHA